MLRRRFTGPVFFGLVTAVLLLGAGLFARILASGGWTFAEGLLFGVFGLLFGYLSFGFCHALVGAWLRWRRLRQPDDESVPSGVEADRRGNGRVAIVMPVYNEPVERVFRGLRAIFRSMGEQPDGDAFDVHILSDSNRSAQWLAEERAWLLWLREEGVEGRVFYRRRARNVGKKAGNVADFCRDRGGDYEFMVVLDADSVMTGATLSELRRRIMAEPGVALIQTVPRLVGGRSLYGRLQQFANRLYGPLFMDGLDYWQQGGGNFWGHNAIIRVKPFMDECGLPELPGPEPFGGPILSHDFVEAGLLCRAGWEVRLAPELVGTYEEGPQSLVDAAQRDRRWCQGNLQHAVLLAARGLRWRTRLHFLNGIMGYLSSPLWLLMMGLGVLVLAENGPGDPGPPARLLVITALLLFLPKLLCVLDLLGDPRRCQAFAGFARALLGAVVETLFSALIAPMNMAFHTRFVLWNLMGRKVAWNTQERGANGTAWGEAWTVHAGQLALGVGLAWLSWAVGGAGALLLVSPVALGLLGAVPISVFTSRAQRWAAGILLTPEETGPPPELVAVTVSAPTASVSADEDFARVIVDPYWNAVHLALLDDSPSTVASTVVARLLGGGPAELREEERMWLLGDRKTLGQLHLRLWQRSTGELSAYWRRTMQQLVDESLGHEVRTTGLAS